MKDQSDYHKALQEQLWRVAADLKIEDPNFTKFKCPICKGVGLTYGKWISATSDPKKIGKCLFCGGTGVARRKKKFNE